MIKNNETFLENVQLRRQAEKRLSAAAASPVEVAEKDDPGRLLHELQVHQIELELQNEELRRSRSELEDLLERYADLYEFAPVGYFTLTAQGTIVQANLTGAEILGFERGRITGLALNTFFTPDSHAVFQSFLELLQDSPAKESCEVKLGKGADYRCLHIEGSAVNGNHTEDGRYRLAVVDISERKKAEEALRELTESQQTLLRCLPVGVIMVDQHSRIVELNARGETILGHSREEALGQICQDFVRAEGSPPPSPWDMSLEMERSAGPLELTILNKERKRIQLRTQAARVPGRDGRMTYAVMTFQDISKIKALQRERENIISMLAHDIKSPLVNILGFAQILARNDSEIAPEKRDRFAEIVRTEGRRLEALLDDFLEFSRLGSGQLALNLAPIDMANLLRETGEAFRPRLERNGISLDMGGISTGPLMVEADGPRMRRVLTNLLENALKYSLAGSTVVLETAQVAEHVLLGVRDHGVGIPEDELPNIFDMFYRGWQANPTQGHGLGLAGVDAIVKSHGGQVLVSSAEGKGSTFTVVLPKQVR